MSTQISNFMTQRTIAADAKRASSAYAMSAKIPKGPEPLMMWAVPELRLAFYAGAVSAAEFFVDREKYVAALKTGNYEALDIHLRGWMKYRLSTVAKGFATYDFHQQYITGFKEGMQFGMMTLLANKTVPRIIDFYKSAIVAGYKETEARANLVYEAAVQEPLDVKSTLVAVVKKKASKALTKLQRRVQARRAHRDQG